jgi:cell division septum initiation protein DivIVA
MFLLDKVKKLTEEIKELKRENKKLRRNVDYYNERVKLLDEKEKKYDAMLSYLESQNTELKQTLQEAKLLRIKLEKIKQ